MSALGRKRLDDRSMPQDWAEGLRGSPNFKRGRDGATMRSREPASNSSSKERRQARNEVGTANGPPAVLCDTDGTTPCRGGVS